MGAVCNTIPNYYPRDHSIIRSSLQCIIKTAVFIRPYHLNIILTSSSSSSSLISYSSRMIIAVVIVIVVLMSVSSVTSFSSFSSFSSMTSMTSMISRSSIRMPSFHRGQRCGHLKALSMNIYTSTFTPYKDSDRININAVASTSLTHSGDVLVIPFYSVKKDDSLKSKIPTGLSKELKLLVEEVLDEGIFKADVSQKQVLRISSSSSSSL